ncbi:MAG: hypothetical protein QGG73_09525, partial [Candidatus Hydrogenedentes bacterium]|nr:hypothetical protein [Candidatus Hydrogenedentota bacterium]
MSYLQVDKCQAPITFQGGLGAFPGTPDGRANSCAFAVLISPVRRAGPCHNANVPAEDAADRISK